MTLKKMILLFLIIGFPVSAALKPGVQAPDFALKDADDNPYTLSEMRGKIVILLFGTRDARKEGDKVMLAIDRDYGRHEGINFFLIADLRGLPFFVTEGMVKWGVRREKIPFTTLLDWDGKVAQKYDATKGLPSSFIIDRQGKIVYGYSGKFSDESYSRFQKKLNLILAADRSEQYKLLHLCKKMFWNIVVYTLDLFLIQKFPMTRF